MSTRLTFWGVMATAIGLSVSMPGLAPFINDEPFLISNALAYNEMGKFASKGLSGNFNISYGPIPTWIYQILLYFTHDIFHIVTFHAVGFVGLLAGGLLWLGHELRWRRAFILVVILSPAMAFYARMLWDNSLNIPISVLLLASYVRMLRTQSGLCGFAVAALSVVALSIHLTAFSLVAAIVVHALWRMPRLAWRAAPWMGVGILAVGIVLSGYIRSQTPAIRNWSMPKPEEMPPAMAGAPVFHKQSPPKAAWFAFSGTQILTSHFTLIPRSQEGWALAWERGLGYASWLVYPLFVGGLGLALVSFWRKYRDRDPVVEASTVGWIALLIQAGYFAGLRVFDAQHYFNGIFAIYPLFAWLCVDRLGDMTGRLVIGVLGVSMLGLTVLMMLRLHSNGGDLALYGSTLEQQHRVVREVLARNSTALVTDAQHLKSFPIGIITLARLEGVPATAVKSRPYPSVCVEQTSPTAASMEFLEMSKIAPGRKLTYIELRTPVPFRE